ncbi:MAG: hypothetical protein HQK52_16330 [Oligoflexia bacterium]|nr:hypothetical protein [Oligoflexia bacterium]
MFKTTRTFLLLMLFLIVNSIILNNSFGSTSCGDAVSLKDCLQIIVNDLNAKEKLITALQMENARLNEQIEGMKSGSIIVAQANLSNRAAFADEADKSDKLRGRDNYHWLRVNGTGPDNREKLQLWRSTDGFWFDYVRAGAANYAEESDRCDKLRGRDNYHWLRVNGFGPDNREKLQLWRSTDGFWFDLIRVSACNSL